MYEGLRQGTLVRVCSATRAALCRTPEVMIAAVYHGAPRNAKQSSRKCGRRRRAAIQNWQSGDVPLAQSGPIHGLRGTRMTGAVLTLYVLLIPLSAWIQR